MNKRIWAYLAVSCVALSVLGSSASAQLQKLVLPNDKVNAEGSTATSRPIRNASSETLQFIIASSQLTAITPGQFVVGLSFRLDPLATLAQSNLPLTFADYSIYIGQTTVSPLAADPIFANNYSGARTQVRSGQLDLPGGFFPFGGSPSAFGSTIGFNMNGGGYQYNGGNLIVELRHSSSPNGEFALDAQANSSEYASFFADSNTGTVRDGGTAAAIMQLAFSQQAILPEPGTLVLLSLGALGLITMRKAPSGVK